MSSTWMACRRQLFPFPPSGSSVFPAAGLQPVLIFLLGGQSAADVALRLVDVQHHPGLGRQGGSDVGEAVGDVCMYCPLRSPQLCRRLAHRSILVYDVIGDLDRPFFDIFLHGSSPGNVLYIICTPWSCYDRRPAAFLHFCRIPPQKHPQR